ncbi:type 4 fimbrial methyltransferase PilK [Oceaniserpentilla sp. 4NH20-0058]|uniref:CheR family methyltransferase n=1 Tax=Oceaniserpentilla sp. 4NH20-0058 TaxID=3127660 RepID=UPI003103FB5E
MSQTGWTLKTLPEMTDQQFSLWRELLETRTGIYVTEQRKSYLQSSLTQRMREVACDDFQEYYESIVRDPMGNIEWARLVDRLTVQETRFYRDPEALAYVSKFISTHKNKYNKKNPLDIWSVGCSSGEEVYSLAMVANEVLASEDVQGEYLVTGTDISLPVLNKAREGKFAKRRLINLPEHYLKTYFTQEDEQTFGVVPEIKKHTGFAQVNVLQLNQVSKSMRHIIYCQNVLIYFRHWRRQEILDQLVERLAPGGLLLIGMGEMLDWQHPDLTPVKGEQITAFIKRV